MIFIHLLDSISHMPKELETKLKVVPKIRQKSHLAGNLANPRFNCAHIGKPLTIIDWWVIFCFIE